MGPLSALESHDDDYDNRKNHEALLRRHLVDLLDGILTYLTGPQVNFRPIKKLGCITGSLLLHYFLLCLDLGGRGARATVNRGGGTGRGGRAGVDDDRAGVVNLGLRRSHRRSHSLNH